MNYRPDLSKSLDADTFQSFYYLKEELQAFCRENGLPTSGSKMELAERITHYLEHGEVLSVASVQKRKPAAGEILDDAHIESDFVCSERHRAFFKERIGKAFTFNVQFQQWLKSNAGKTYAQAIDAYRSIMDEKRSGKTVIDKQFEYNTYIRDFFEENKQRTLSDAICCWKYKKSLRGHNRYEAADLVALEVH